MSNIIIVTLFLAILNSCTGNSIQSNFDKTDTALQAKIITKTLKDSIIIEEIACGEKRKCDCVKQVFKQDSNIYFINQESNSKNKFEGDSHCFKIDLILYGFTISLDSIYYKNIINKEVKYIHGYYGGYYYHENENITLELFFINNGINTSQSTSHVYTVKYNKKANKKPTVNFKFIDD